MSYTISESRKYIVVINSNININTFELGAVPGTSDHWYEPKGLLYSK